MKLGLCFSFALFILSMGTAAAQNPSIELWPEGIPGSRTGGSERGHEDSASPKLTVFRPAVNRANGTAIIVCPGGAYAFLSTEGEGNQYAQWLSTLGITAFVLEYRLGSEGTFAPLQDVLRSVRLLRSRAKEFNISADRIGVMGSSAGGHLAASAATLYDRPEGKTGAPLDSTSARPDFVILMYPVISMEEGITHARSRQCLLGSDPTPALVELMSAEKQVTAATPPALIIHSQNDPGVPVENSVRFFQALTRAGVPAEMYLFERGGHGMAMSRGFGTASEWPHRAEEWLQMRGWLTPPPRILPPQ